MDDRRGAPVFPRPNDNAFGRFTLTRPKGKNLDLSVSSPHLLNDFINRIGAVNDTQRSPRLQVMKGAINPVL